STRASPPWSPTASTCSPCPAPSSSSASRSSQAATASSPTTTPTRPTTSPAPTSNTSPSTPACCWLGDRRDCSPHSHGFACAPKALFRSGELNQGGFMLIEHTKRQVVKSYRCATLHMRVQLFYSCTPWRQL